MRVKLVINTGFVGARHEDEITIPDEEVQSMSEKAFEQRMQEEVQDFINNHIEAFYEVVDDSEDDNG